MKRVEIIPMSDEEKTISSYLVKTLGLDSSDVQIEAPLFSAGLLDSFAMMDLVSFI
jgi:acyl carrier protein